MVSTVASVDRFVCADLIVLSIMKHLVNHNTGAEDRDVIFGFDDIYSIAISPVPVLFTDRCHSATRSSELKFMLPE